VLQVNLHVGELRPPKLGPAAETVTCKREDILVNCQHLPHLICLMHLKRCVLMKVKAMVRRHMTLQ